jgi:aminoglycoside 6'-N-acetyltransferase
MYRHAGIDIHLSPRSQGHGLGTEAVSLLARFLYEQRGHHRLTIDPAAANHRAIRCYEKVGFRRVGCCASMSAAGTGDSTMAC